MIQPVVVFLRYLPALSLGLFVIALSASLRSHAAETEWKPTPQQVLGPFYPVMKPADKDADLTAIKGKAGTAKGQVLFLSGRVLDLKGKPVPGVEVEIWQTNAAGRYTHPADANPAPLDPNFEGYGVTVTDAEGRYRFKTIKPGAYPASPDWTRPPHIHFSVTSSTYRLVTQLYFEGEPLNGTDLLLKDTAGRERLITPLAPAKDAAPGSLSAVWDIVLLQK